MPKTLHNRIIWQAFPSWGQFSWLYFFAILTAFRGMLFLRLGLPGWQIWIAGAVVLLLVVALIRRWAYYVVTPTCVSIKNGYTKQEIASIRLEMIKDIDIVQGPIARLWGIGTLVIQSTETGKELKLRGVQDPDVVEAKMRALLPTRHSDTQDLP
ncbi:PH domain-containing protein [Nitrospira sp. M1]